MIIKNARRILIHSTILFGLTGCLSIGEAFAYGDASLGEQIVQQLTLSDQLTQQMQQVQQQISLVQQGAQNLQGLTQQAWNSVSARVKVKTCV